MCTTAAQLEASLNEIRSSITLDVLHGLFDSIPRRMQDCIRLEGAPVLTQFVRTCSATISQPSHSRQPATNTKHADDIFLAVSAYSAWQKMFVLGETPQFWEIWRCVMRHGAHIALIPNQLSPVHRDMQIYMSLQLEGFQPHKRSI